MAWPFDSEEQLDEWVDVYIAAHRQRPETEADQEAAFLASEPGHVAPYKGHAEDLWRFILKVIERRPSEWALGMLAAGPVEDLISMCGCDFINRIEVEARRNPLFRETLLGVWQNSTAPDLWARVERARGTLPAQAP